MRKPAVEGFLRDGKVGRCKSWVRANAGVDRTGGRAGKGDEDGVLRVRQYVGERAGEDRKFIGSAQEAGRFTADVHEAGFEAELAIAAEPPAGLHAETGTLAFRQPIVAEEDLRGVRTENAGARAARAGGGRRDEGRSLDAADKGEHIVGAGPEMSVAAKLIEAIGEVERCEGTFRFGDGRWRRDQFLGVRFGRKDARPGEKHRECRHGESHPLDHCRASSNGASRPRAERTVPRSPLLRNSSVIKVAELSYDSENDFARGIGRASGESGVELANEIERRTLASLRW